MMSAVVGQRSGLRRRRSCRRRAPGAALRRAVLVFLSAAALLAGGVARADDEPVGGVEVVEAAAPSAAPAAPAATPPPALPPLDDVAPEASSSYPLQPRVTVMQGLPSFHGIQSISFPGGSPWCGGAPTSWVTGHEFLRAGRPRCLVDGRWIPSPTAAMSMTTIVDRHACVTMDVNRDGLPDLICSIGAGSGRGEGFTELYMTLPNGTLSLLGEDSGGRSEHGLQKYPSMRTRVAATLRNSRGVSEYVFIGTQGSRRQDNRTNHHRMFRNVYTAPDAFPYFVEVPGPWTRQLFGASCVVGGDFTGDGVDDLIVCNQGGRALLARQGASGSFVSVPLPVRSGYVARWRKARLADVTGDGRKDLVVVAANNILLVFKGRAASPYFDFLNPYYQRDMGWTAVDVEVLDVNRDGRADLYVSKVNSARGQFCGPHGKVIYLPDNETPPLDKARDVLLLGNNRRTRFTIVQMQHSRPGCGSIVQRWDARTMLLAQGDFNHPGFDLLLEW